MRALIVDDSRPMRTMMGRMVAELGFAVGHAADGIDALAQLEQNGRPDVVLLDWNLSDMNGFTILTAIRADPRWSDLPVIVVATATERSQLARVLDHAMSECLIKPFTKEDLHGKLGQVGVLSVI